MLKGDLRETAYEALLAEQKVRERCYEKMSANIFLFAFCLTFLAFSSSKNSDFSEFLKSKMCYNKSVLYNKSACFNKSF